MGENRSTRRKPTTFGRALTILFQHEGWLRVQIKMNLVGIELRTLEAKGKWSDHYWPPKPHTAHKKLIRIQLIKDQYSSQKNWYALLRTRTRCVVMRTNFFVSCIQINHITCRSLYIPYRIGHLDIWHGSYE